MCELTSAFTAFAQSIRCDLLGIAPIERFAGLPPERHPSSIFPEAKSVVVVGKRIPRGTLRGVEEGTQFFTYHLYGQAWVEDRFLALTALRLSEFLEDHRWEAVPLFNLPPEMGPMGVPVREGQPAPNVLLDFDDAAVRAGLGEIGYLRTFVSPEFGTRQRFFLILTDAELEPTPLPTTDVCPRKKEFARFCPLGAIDPTTEETVEICGRRMPVAGIDFAKCAVCQNGARPNLRHPSGAPDRLAAVCLRTYYDHLERAGRLTRTFAQPFRQRPTWVIADGQTRDEANYEVE
jgi:hypothetical protein